MNLRRIVSGLLAAGLACVSMAACAAGCAPQVQDGWVRLTPGGMPMHAGFGRIENACDAEAVVVGVSSPAYGSVELHQSSIVDGVSRMRAVPELRIAPGHAAVLEPGGLHLMLMQPTAALQPGDSVEIEFTLAGGGKVPAKFEVRSPGG